jgi:hypothetical protein
MTTPIKSPRAREIYLVTNGDLRLSANQTCWPAQKELEERLTGRDEAPLARNHVPVADHACGVSRRYAEPVHGHASRQPRTGGVCSI